MKDQKSYAVIGLGTFGAQAARELYEHNQDVIAIDRDQDIIDHIRAEVTTAIRGDGTDEQVLESTGILDVDVVVVAMRKFFEDTVHVTHLLKRRGIKEVWVQVNSHRESSAIRALGATETIFPEYDMARNVVQQLIYPNLAEFLPLGGDFGLVEIDIKGPFVGKTLIQLDVRKRFRVNVVGIKREAKRKFRTESVLVDPTPDEPLREGDILLVLGNMERLSRFTEALEEKHAGGQPSGQTIRPN